MRRRLLIALAVLVASLLGLGASALFYKRYADVHRRSIAPMPRCLLAARRLVMKQADVSGSEPYPTPEGELYLTPDQSRAVHCLESISKPVADKFARAFTEEEPELRGLELLKILREVPADPASDREATATYFMGVAAVRALPELPETKAALEELNELHGCRFYVRRLRCESRPPIPVTVWLTGVPSAAGVLFALFVFMREGARRALDWRKARREKAERARETVAPAEPAAPDSEKEHDDDDDNEAPASDDAPASDAKTSKPTSGDEPKEG